MAWFEIPAAAQVQEGGMQSLKIEGKEILVTKYKGRYYAINNRCPHMGGDLSRGELNGKTVTCPQHGHKIDITTGNHASLLNLSFNRKSSAKNAYEVKTEGSKLFINL